MVDTPSVFDLVPAETPNEALLNQLTDEHRQLVETGVYNVFPGKDYPVLRWATGPLVGKLATGTGITPNHNDSAAVGRASAFKQTAEYKTLLTRYLPADLDDTKRGSLGWILKNALNGLEGGDMMIDVECPHCGEEFRHKAWKKPDPQMAKLLVEALIGKAGETKDVNINSENIYRLMDERRDLRSLQVFEIDPHEREKREAIDAEWRLE